MSVAVARKHTGGKKATPIMRRALAMIQYDIRFGCWWWLGSRRGNYGKVAVTRSSGTSAHRLMYRLFKGPIPDGMHIDHLCRHQTCVNPDHLEAVTPRENWRRGHAPSALALDRTHCARGHLMDAANTLTYGGLRRCRSCLRERLKRERREGPRALGKIRAKVADAYLTARSRPSAGAIPTHCKRGHEFTPENTLLRSDGHRRCRACNIARVRESRRRLKSADL